MPSTLSKLLLAAAISLIPVAASAAGHHHKTMTVQLADGRTITFTMIRIHGRMMAVTPCHVDSMHGLVCN